MFKHLLQQLLVTGVYMPVTRDTSSVTGVVVVRLGSRPPRLWVTDAKQHLLGTCNGAHGSVTNNVRLILGSRSVYSAGSKE